MHVRYAIVVLAALIAWPSAWAGDTAPLSFNKDIRPILSNTCYRCHGFDVAAREADLRLDETASATATRENGQAIVPGDALASLAIQRMRDPDPNRRMPPPESNLSISDDQIALIEQWINEGAQYQDHWAYITPSMPEPPKSDWGRNEIDAFIAAVHQREGVTPSPEADRATLIRRLSFDLTGLPPTYEEVEAFIADTEPGAYERVVDRLLASPHYGERMAVDWLDQVRYADTNGFHSDEHRNAWPYRDYVINAFNSNKPFDQFTVEQLAGDLLPDATLEQQVASGYNRMNQITAEGGAQAKEYLHKYMADRVRAVGSVWLGSTLGCAECHDHKYDPFSAKEFYSMGAFFADIEEKGVYPGGSRWDPVLQLPTAEQSAQLAEYDEKLAALDKVLSTPTEELTAAQVTWEASMVARLQGDADPWSTRTPTKTKSSQGATMVVDDNGRVLVSGDPPAQDRYTISLKPGAGTVTGIRLDTFDHENYGRGPSNGNRNFVLTGFKVDVDLPGKNKVVAITRAEASFEQATWPIANVLDNDSKTGWAIEANVQPKDAAAVFVFTEPVNCDDDTELQVHMRFESVHAHHTIDYFSLATTTDAIPSLDPLGGLPEPIQVVLRKPAGERTDEDRKTLSDHYMSIAPALAPQRAEKEAVAAEREEFFNSLPYTLVTRSVEPREIRLLPRGNFLDETGPVVTPAVPASLHPLNTENERPTRLDLANWIVDPANPLTARVTMNRTWKLFFGEGLSGVLDDFGAQGEWPTHPELLDWLAGEFVASGWDVKHMVRLMVTSATYRQQSIATPKMRERDPFNRLYARQSRGRLQAEFVRNNALSVAGILSTRLGGRSVFPYQPDGYWDDCNTFRGKLEYNTDQGANQYRRGLYTYWKRSFLHPSMMAFDAPNREECVAERTVSNTPLQALVLLNDPTYVEAARAFAERMYREGGTALGDRMEWAYKHALAREPRPEEKALLLGLYHEQLARYSSDAEAAKAALTIGQQTPPEDIPLDELAAWKAVARAILNLHETISRT